MVREYNLRVLPQIAASESSLKHFVCQEKGLDGKSVKAIQIVKRSIDARQRTIYFQLQVRVFINEEPQEQKGEQIIYQDVSNKPQVIVVGAGPAGLFAALRLIELGRRPIVVERGKNVSERKRDLATAVRTHHIHPESNYCFGEGGAGAYSDGKLYTRSKKRGNVQRILQIFHQFGASENILVEAHPHIGTDRLPRIISKMREQIIACGGEVHFETRMTELICENNVVKGIRCHNGLEFNGPVILATGHSARDVYQMLHLQGFPLEAKGFAMGVRLEHPQMLIDQLMYHSPKGRGQFLPAAEYSFVKQAEGRGVYSFCMCPGGFIVPAGDKDGIIVVNGMSPSNRGSKWANSGMVVEILPEDLPKFASLIQQFENDPIFTENFLAAGDNLKNNKDYLQMLRLQMAYERLCYQQVENGLIAPAQRMDDFVNQRHSKTLPSSSYVPGLQSSDLHRWMPEEIRKRLQMGFRMFNENVRGFLTNEAQLIAAETRTSSPVRIPRDREGLNLCGYEGLFPCGEGAGFAGGIVSSAIDGELCAEKAALL